jgi:hypothetical protein
MHSAFIASTNMKLKHGLILIGLTSLLLGCEQLGIEDPTVEKAREEAEGKAIGSGCRQTGRVLEECYQLNRKAPKAAIFSGWRDMDAYMRENKIPEIKPEAPAENPLLANEGTPKPAPEAAAPKSEAAAAKAAERKDAKSPTTAAKPAPAAPAKNSH